MITQKFLNSFGYMIRTFSKYSLILFEWDISSNTLLSTVNPSKLFAFKIQWAIFFFHGIANGICILNELSPNSKLSLFAKMVLMMWLLALNWSVLVMANIWKKHKEISSLVVAFIRMDSEMNGICKMIFNSLSLLLHNISVHAFQFAVGRGYLMEKGMQLVNLLFLVGSIVCSIVAWAMLDQSFIYRFVPEKYRSHLLFLTFLIIEVYITVGLLAVVFWDLANYLFGIIVSSQFLQNSM